MKKIYLLLALLGALNFSFAQCDIILSDISLVKCFGSDPTMDAGLEVNWYDASENLLHTGRTYNPMGMLTMLMPAGNYTYLVQPVGCTTFSSINLEVVQVPTPVVDYEPVIIAGSLSVMTATAPSNYQFRWFIGATLVATGNTYIPLNTTVGTYSLQVVAVDNMSGCQSDPLNISYTVTQCLALPPVAEATNYSVEDGLMPILSVTSGNLGEATSFCWRDEAGTLLAQGVSSFTPEAIPVGQIRTFYVSEILLSSSCESISIAITVDNSCKTQKPTFESVELYRRVNELPTPISLTNVLAEGETVRWSVDSLETIYSETYTPSFTEIGTHYITVQIHSTVKECTSSPTYLYYTILPCLDTPSPVSPTYMDMYLHEDAPIFEVEQTSVWYDANMNKIGEGTTFSPNIFKTGESVFKARQETDNCIGQVTPFYLYVRAYTISGRLFYDQNNDGVFDEDYDKIISNKSILIKETNSIVSTDFWGYYTFQTDVLGTYTLSVQDMGENVESLGNTEIVVVLSNDKPYGNGVDFRFRMKENFDLSVNAIPSNLIAVGRTVFYNVSVKNSGKLQENVSFKFTYDASLMDFIPEFSNATLVDSTITVDLGTIQALSKLTYSLQFVVKPDWTIGGDTINTYVEIISANVDVLPNDNNCNSSNVIRNSYDPNDKAVTPSMLDDGYVLLNSELTYTIRFQNKGTGEAYDIYVKDTIDEKMDISSFAFVAASHNMTYTINGNVITFYFTNIMLPYESENAEGSNGYIQYTIKPKAGMTDKTVVNNTAHIFFDFNPAVVTNTTISTFVETLPIIKEETKLQEKNAIISISPNPTSEQLNITVSLEGKKLVSLIDVTGVNVFVGQFEGDSAMFNVSKLSAGTYTLLISNDSETISEKVVIK